MNYRTGFAFMAFAIFLTVSRPVSAAETPPRIYFRTAQETFAAGEEFAVGIFLDSSQPVNALDVEVGYAPDLLEYTGSNNAYSMVDIWKEEPVVTEGGVIRIQGGLLRPFSGTSGEIIQFRFRPLAPGNAQISLRNGRLYKADGLGTKLQAPNTFVEFAIDAGTGSPADLPEPADESAPELDLVLFREPVSGRLLLSVEASDPESGIEHSLVRSRKFLQWSNWQPLRNPLAVPSGAWAISVRSVNGSGLTSESEIYIRETIIRKGLGALTSMVIILAGAFWAYNKRKHL